MGEKSPPKVARFLVWCSATPENREDILIAFDEMHSLTAAQFGERYARAYSTWQGVRSLPFGVVTWSIKIFSLISKLGG